MRKRDKANAVRCVVRSDDQSANDGRGRMRGAISGKIGDEGSDDVFFPGIELGLLQDVERGFGRRGRQREAIVAHLASGDAV